MELELNKIGKKFENVVALQNCSIKFEEQIYGILGPNGAGKSTLLKILTGNLTGYYGEIRIDGQIIKKQDESYRKRLGYMPQEIVGYSWMRVHDFMEYMAVLKGMHPKNEETKKQILYLLDRVNLTQHLHKRFSTLSGGMKRRVLFAQALLGNPQIMILDEPTAGLDPKERISMRNLIAEVSTNKIVLVATHIVSDIECIAKNILFMQCGSFLDCKTPTEWIQGLKGHVVEAECTLDQVHELEKKYVVSSVRQGSENIVVRIVGDEFPENIETIQAEASIDDVYLYYSECRSF